MQNNYKTKILNGVLFFLLLGIFYFYANYFYVGGFGVGYQYVICMVIAVIGGLSFLAVPRLRLFIECVKTAGIMSTSYVMCIIVSLGIWIFTFTRIRQMISGFFAPIYILISAACVSVLVYFLREKAVVYAFWSMSTAFFIMIFQQIRIVGIREFFYEMYVLVISASTDTLPAMRVLEGPRFSYCYGLFFIYFLFQKKNMPTWKFILRMAVCIFCFLAGFKRSCILATLFGLIVALIFFRSNVSFRRKFVNILIVVFVVFAIGYIPVIRYGVFDRVVEALQIDTSHRNELYDYYFDYYEFNPSYIGQGFGWVQNHIEGKEGLAAYDVHNEYLRNYIELGFWGYLFWVFTVFPWVIKRVISYKDVRDDTIIAGSMVYMSILYITENIFLFYTFFIVLCTIVMSCHVHSNLMKVDESE